MLELHSIDDSLCGNILHVYQSNPLIRVIAQPDAEVLLRSSFHVLAHEGTDNRLDSSHYEDLLGDYIKKTPAESVSIPALLLEGSIRLDLPSDGANPLSVPIDAPLIGYLIPYVFESGVIKPSIIAEAGARGIIFHPEVFRKIAYKNPRMFEVLAKDNEKITVSLLKWLSINSLAPISYRLARLLMARLPATPKDNHSEIKVSQAELADLLNCSRSTLAKGISALYDKGIIYTGHGKIIVNVPKVREFLSHKNLRP